MQTTMLLSNNMAATNAAATAPPFGSNNLIKTLDSTCSSTSVVDDVVHFMDPLFPELQWELDNIARFLRSNESHNDANLLAAVSQELSTSTLNLRSTSLCSFQRFVSDNSDLELLSMAGSTGVNPTAANTTTAQSMSSAESRLSLTDFSSDHLYTSLRRTSENFDILDDLEILRDDDLAASFMGSVTDLVEHMQVTDDNPIMIEPLSPLHEELNDDVKTPPPCASEKAYVHFDPVPVTDKLVSIDKNIKRISTPACALHSSFSSSGNHRSITDTQPLAPVNNDCAKRRKVATSLPENQYISGNTLTPNGDEEPSTIRVSLENGDLWEKFHRNTNEMITSSRGRHMFPVLKLNVAGLDPDRLYMVWIHFACNGSEQDIWKWNEKQQKWVCKQKMQKKSLIGTGENPGGGKMRSSSRATDRFPLEHSSELTQSALSRMSSVKGTRPPDVYNHPASPSAGAFWMHMAISFDKLRLTNKAENTDHVFLESFRKYTPVVYFAPVPSEDDKCPAIHRFRLDIAGFVAATAYHNKRIAELKILSNPMAKSQLQQVRPEALELLTKPAAKANNNGKGQNTHTVTASTVKSNTPSTPNRTTRSTSLDNPYPTPSSPSSAERTLQSTKATSVRVPSPVRQIWTRSMDNLESEKRVLNTQVSPFLHGGIYEVRQQQSPHIRVHPYAPRDMGLIRTPIQSPIPQSPTELTDITIPTYGTMPQSRRSSFDIDIYGVSSLDSFCPLFEREIMTAPASPIGA